jgi:pantoate--beta-alanine ligase
MNVDIDLEGLDKKWEGEFRPGHFKGVVQVVKRLLDLVEPHYLFMGQKDFQQFTIIQMMLDKLKISTKLIVVPIFREKDGLAMSSRNVRLTKVFRNKSVVLNKMLRFAKEKFDALSISEIESIAIDTINKSGLKPEYFKIVDSKNLDHLTSSDTKTAIAIVAAWAGDVRLIDNIII